MARILAIILFLFKLYFTAIPNFSPGLLRGHSARQPVPSTDGLLGLTRMTTANGASTVRAVVSEVRLGTSEHGVTFVRAGEHIHHILLYVYRLDT